MDSVFLDTSIQIERLIADYAKQVAIERGLAGIRNVPFGLI